MEIKKPAMAGTLESSDCHGWFLNLHLYFLLFLMMSFQHLFVTPRICEIIIFKRVLPHIFQIILNQENMWHYVFS